MKYRTQKKILKKGMFSISFVKHTGDAEKAWSWKKMVMFAKLNEEQRHWTRSKHINFLVIGAEKKEKKTRVETLCCNAN